MTHYAQIRAALLADVAAAALAGVRIYTFDRAPQPAEQPYVVLQMVSAPANASHDQASSNEMRTYQISCYATTGDVALALRDAVVAALDNVPLSGGDSPTLQSERDSYDQIAELYRADLDVQV